MLTDGYPPKTDPHIESVVEHHTKDPSTGESGNDREAADQTQPTVVERCAEAINSSSSVVDMDNQKVDVDEE